MTISHPAYDDGVLRITCIGSPASLAIAGDIDEYTHAALVDTLRKLTDGLHEIHINLADVAYCDLAGLRAIVLLAGGSANHDGGGTRLVLHEVPGLAENRPADPRLGHHTWPRHRGTRPAIRTGRSLL